MTFSERAIEAAAAKLTDDGVFERDEWYDHPVVKRKRRQALKMARSALSAALAVDGLALVDQRDVAAGLVTVPISDLRTVIEIAGRNEASIEIECIKGYLADATAASDGEVG